MQTLVESDFIVVTLEPGEEIIACLLDVAETHDVRAGCLTGLGSTSEAEIAFFDPEKKEYVPRVFSEPMEIGSMVGNFSRLEDGAHAHVHITVSGPDLIAFTGHLNRAVVGTACEIYVRKLATEVARVKDPEAGFNPLKLK